MLRILIAKVESPFYAFNVFVVNAYTYKSYRHN